MRLKLGTKLILGFMLLVCFMMVISLYSLRTGKGSLLETVGRDSVFLVEEMLKRIDRDIYLKTEDLLIHERHMNLQRGLLESNREFEKLGDIEGYISRKDREWVSEPKEVITPFMEGLINNPLSEELRRTFMEFYERRYGYKIFDEVFVTNRYGANVAQTGKTSDYRQNDENWWQVARNSGFYIGDIEYDESAGTHAVNIAIRIDDDKGNFLGVIKGVFALSSIIKEAEIAKKRYETTEVKLITNDGRLLYSTKPFKILEDIKGKEYFKRIERESGFFVAREGSRKKLFSYAQSKGYRDFRGFRWFLVMGYDEEEILRPIFLLRNRIVFISFVVITISIIIALFISFSISKPVKRLTTVAEDISRGDLDARVNPEIFSSTDEISILASTFNRMAESLKERERELIQRTEALESSQRDALEMTEKLKKEISDHRMTEYALREKAEQLKALYDTGKKITSLISREELLPWIAKQAAKLLGAEVCIYRIREGDYLVRGGGTRGGEELMVREKLKMGESLSGIIAKEKKPLIIDDIKGDKRHIKEHSEVAQRLGFVSFLGVPMMIGDNLVGVMNILTKTPRKFDKRDVEILSAFADHSAVAIETSMLYERIMEKYIQFRALYEVNKMITSETKRENLLPLIAEQAKNLLHADGCNFRLREGDELVRSYGTKQSKALMIKERIKIGESLTGIIAEKKSPLVIEDIREEKRYIKEHREAAKELGFVSFVGVPMMIGDEVMGVIHVFSKEKRKFSEPDIELLSAFAAQAAIALEKTKLFGELEDARERLEEKVVERTKKLQEVQAQLVQSEGLAATGRLAASVAHEINNPLQAIESFVSSVMKNLDDKDSENIEHLKLARQGIIRIAGIVRQLLAFHRPVTESRNLENINSIIQKTLSLTKNQLSLNNIRVKEELCSDLPKTRISAQQIHQVLLNLILNAQDAMPEGGELKIKTAKNKNSISIEVSDTGVGIPEDFMNRIFEPFSTTKKMGKGTGLGLSISYGIIKAHKGDIQVKSKEKEGTTFTIKLPMDIA